MNPIKIKAYRRYNEDEILELYGSVGWSNYVNKPAMLRLAFEHSLSAFGAYSSGQLVGIIRVVGDGHSIIYIQDIIVHPEYQGKGIGRLLLEEVLKRYDDVYQKVLLTDNQPQSVSFYRSSGFSTANELDCVAMAAFKR